MNDQNVHEITLNQPIFNGFSSYNNAKEIQYNIKDAEEYYKFRKGEILLSAIESYLNLFEAQNILNSKSQDKKTLKNYYN